MFTAINIHSPTATSPLSRCSLLIDPFVRSTAYYNAHAGVAPPSVDPATGVVKRNQGALRAALWDNPLAVTTAAEDAWLAFAKRQADR